MIVLIDDQESDWRYLLKNQTENIPIHFYKTYARFLKEYWQNPQHFIKSLAFLVLDMRVPELHKELDFGNKSYPVQDHNAGLIFLSHLDALKLDKTTSIYILTQIDITDDVKQRCYKYGVKAIFNKYTPDDRKKLAKAITDYTQGK